jgi:hypothetical protein
LAAYGAAPGVTSVQITFFEDRPPAAHTMPPGGFRLAVINSVDLDAGVRLRSAMAKDFGLEEFAAEARPVFGATLEAELSCSGSL